MLDYIKHHYRLIAVDFNKQRQFNADSKALQQIELVGKLKKLDDNDNATDDVND